MSRTSSNTIDYFPHMAKHGKTLFILKSRFGNDGYAFWFQLLEILCQSEDHFYDCREEEHWQYLLSFCGSNGITGTEILDLLAKLGNIDPELWGKRVIWCQALVDNFSNIYKKRGRKIPSKPIISDKNNITDNNNALSGTEMPQIKVDKIKEDKKEKSKEKKGEFENVLLSLEEYEKLKNKLGKPHTDDLIEQLSCYMQQNPKNAKKYTDHYAVLIAWSRKDGRLGVNKVNHKQLPAHYTRPEDA